MIGNYTPANFTIDYGGNKQILQSGKFNDFKLGVGHSENIYFTITNPDTQKKKNIHINISRAPKQTPCSFGKVNKRQPFTLYSPTGWIIDFSVNGKKYQACATMGDRYAAYLASIHFDFSWDSFNVYSNCSHSTCYQYAPIISMNQLIHFKDVPEI